MNGNARKKSINSSSGMLAESATAALHIDTPVAMNTMLNKQAATSLYQECLTLRNKLLRIHDFAPYLSLIDHHAELAHLDVVHRLWHCLALGTPLCFLYNLLDLPLADRLAVNTDPEDIDIYEQDPDAALKSKKKAAAFFIMGISKLKNAGQWQDDIELFTVTELTNLDNKDTNGFVKVVATTAHLLTKLPEHVWIPESDTPPLSAHDEANRELRELTDDGTLKPANAQEMDRNYLLKELIDSERKYIQDLEQMHNYARTLMAQDIVDQDTIHHLFPGLNKLLDFQRKFSIELEQQYELPWEQQRWGRCFITNETNFSVYEPYCANFTNASELILAEEPHLSKLAHIINPKSELPAFLIKPIQRICKYPLFFESLVKRAPETYEFYDELVEGAASCKRITDKVNEAQRRAENVATVKLLERRVEDWKGHALSNFGELLLDDVFMVTKSEVDREYHVFLFEKIILCCKDATAPNPNRKVGKSNSILKKQSTSGPPQPGGLLASGAAAKKKTTPLLLKGRIFLNNVTQATPSNRNGAWALQVWWRGDDDLEYFTLRCSSENQVKQWETVITRMVADVQSKREERHRTAPSHHAPYDRQSAASSVSTLPAYTASANPAHQRRTLGSYPDEKNHYGGYAHQPPYTAQHNQPNGWSGGFDDRDDEYDDDQRYPNGPMSAGGYASSGRETPLSSGPQRNRAVSDREYYDRPRRGTEDAASFQQWRQQQNGTPQPGRPPMSSRQASQASGISGMSMQSDASFGNGVGHHRPPQPMLRTQLSSGRLRTQYEDRGGYDDGGRHSQASARARVVSNPSTSHAHHQSHHAAPPVPIAPQWTGSSQSSGSGGVDPARIASGPSRERLGSGARNGSSLAMVRPRSGGSSDTGDSSEHSPDIGPGIHTTSGGTLRGSRSQIFNGNSNAPPGYGQNGGYSNSNAGYGVQSPIQGRGGAASEAGPPVKIKVYWLDDLFVIMVPRTTGYNELVQRVQKKIRLCGGGNTEGPLRLKYDDEDGDRISLSTDEELQMAFDMSISRFNGQGQLTLRVH